MNNSKIKISKEKNAIKGTDKNVQIQDFRLNESDFNPLIILMIKHSNYEMSKNLFNTLIQ